MVTMVAMLAAGCGHAAPPILVSPAAVRAAANWHPASAPLMTRWAKAVSPASALPDYPRPQMARPLWQSLDGLWDYALTDSAATTPPAAFDAGRICDFLPLRVGAVGRRQGQPGHAAAVHCRQTIGGQVIDVGIAAAQ